MTGWCRALAVDFDGTLGEGAVAPLVAERLSRLRTSGVRVLVVTGRILSELFAVAPALTTLVEAARVALIGALRARRCRHSPQLVATDGETGALAESRWTQR